MQARCAAPPPPSPCTHPQPALRAPKQRVQDLAPLQLLRPQRLARDHMVRDDARQQRLRGARGTAGRRRRGDEVRRVDKARGGKLAASKAAAQRLLTGCVPLKGNSGSGCYLPWLCLEGGMADPHACLLMQPNGSPRPGRSHAVTTLASSHTLCRTHRIVQQRGVAKGKFGGQALKSGVGGQEERGGQGGVCGVIGSGGGGWECVCVSSLRGTG
jgi:hypothetical protein